MVYFREELKFEQPLRRPADNTKKQITPKKTEFDINIAQFNTAITQRWETTWESVWSREWMPEVKYCRPLPLTAQIHSLWF